jgi:hypothetical protein
MATLFDYSGCDDAERDRMRDWRDGISVARIRWQDELGVKHLCLATERSWALEQLAVIACEPDYRLVSCVVWRSGLPNINLRLPR